MGRSGSIPGVNFQYWDAERQSRPARNSTGLVLDNHPARARGPLRGAASRVRIRSSSGRVSRTHCSRSQSPNGSRSAHENKVGCGIIAIRVTPSVKWYLYTMILPKSGPFLLSWRHFLRSLTAWGQFCRSRPIPSHQTASRRGILGEKAHIGGILSILTLSWKG